MKMTDGRRCLSGVDAAFLYLERKELPLSVADVMIFEKPLPFEEFVATLDSRMHLLPRYRQVPKAAPYDLGHPVWEFARHFDIRQHVFPVRLDPPGSERQLEALASRVLSEPMGRDKPIWDIRLVEGLSDGRGAMIIRVHHSMADGVSGMALLRVILDQTPQHAMPARRVRYRPPKEEGYSLTQALGNAIQGTLENLLASQAVLAGIAKTLMEGPVQMMERLAGVLPELASPVEKLPFNKPCQEGREFRWAEINFGKVKEIRAALGGTVNDVILTVVARAIARYAKLHGETVANRFARVVCPVSTRDGDNGESMGNRITFMPVDLPLGITDAGEHLKAVAARTETMKSVRAADLVTLLATWLGAAPPVFQKMFWAGLPEIVFPMPPFNMICTNVPGSPVALYSCGRRLLAAYPHVPTGSVLGVNCAVQSYAGKLCFGLTADAHACPDVDKLRDFLLVAFKEICRAAGVSVAGKRRRPAEARGAPPAACSAAASEGGSAAASGGPAEATDSAGRHRTAAGGGY
jgi:diacylglycerol O-acyltransferase